jgi:hypothetical protein
MAVGLTGMEWSEARPLQPQLAAEIIDRRSVDAVM